MEEEPKELIVLGAIKNGIKKFDKIQKVTQVDPKELNEILESLEKREFIKVEEKKGWLGKKIEIKSTEKGDKEVDERVHELQTKWNQMAAVYKTGDKDKMKDMMDNNRSFLPMMMFFWSNGHDDVFNDVFNDGCIHGGLCTSRRHSWWNG